MTQNHTHTFPTGRASMGLKPIDDDDWSILDSLYLDRMHVFLQLWSFPVFLMYLTLVIGWSRLQSLTSKDNAQWKPWLSPHSMLTRLIILAYNGGAVYLSFRASSELYQAIQRAPSLWVTIDHSSPFLRRGLQVYYLSKLYELADTFWMLARGKRKQVSSLHLLHHSSMILLSDFALFRTPYITMVPALLLNSFVHIILYSYYSIALFTPFIGSWLKLPMTVIQIAQFVFLTVFHFKGWRQHHFCLWSLIYTLYMLISFMNIATNAVTTVPSSSKKNSDNEFHQKNE